MTTSLLRRAPLAAAALLALAVPAAAAGTTSPAPTPSPGPGLGQGLGQVIDRDQPTVTGKVGLGTGHVDIGPREREGTWSLEVHDGTDATPVWRPLDDVVLTVPDAARLTVPDNPAYSFLGVDPGAQVHVLPQTQDPDVVWVGWNTQDPGVMDVVDRGVTLTMDAVQGPGDLVVYLQSGNLTAPTVLWDSRKKGPQGIFVDVDTHTHANWVFTRPGAYLVHLSIGAPQRDGTIGTARGVLRVAVGADTTVDDAFAVKASAVTTGGDGATAASADEGAGASSTVWLVAAAGGGALVLAAGVWTTARGRRVRRLAAEAP